MLVLTVLQGPDKGRRFDLPDHEPQMIGRSSESLPLSDQTISRRHAELTPEGDGRWYIRDLKSANGTFVNGVRVNDRRVLRPGDQIRTGASLIVFGEDSPVAKAGLGIRVMKKGEIDINVEHTVESNDDSMIMAVPEPSQAAEMQLRVIYQLVALIGSVMDRQELLERVMDLIFEHFQADRGFILLTDQNNPKEPPAPAVVRHRLTPPRGGSSAGPVDVGAGDGPAREGNGPIEVSRTIVGYVMRKGVGVLSSNAMADTRFATGDSVQNYGIRSALCVPIKFKDRLYGVIHLDSQVANYTYTEDQLLLLTAIGVQTGLSLNNMRQYEQRLQSERLAAVGQTVASLSHSIKNILQGMRGGADVVELGLRKDNMNVARNGWEIVARNLERIFDLTMNMLAYSKQRRPEFEMTNLPQLLAEVCALMQKQFDAKKVALIQDYASDLPPAPVDPGGLHQAVLNLLNNALDAVEPESGVVSVRCGYDAAGQQIVITVADNGEGIGQATLKRLFEPFHSTKGYQGTGLGLVVTKKIVDEHGGRVDVESGRGQGTTFTLRLPLDLKAAPASAETQGPT